jgi:hypothetical protein
VHHHESHLSTPSVVFPYRCGRQLRCRTTATGIDKVAELFFHDHLTLNKMPQWAKAKWRVDDASGEPRLIPGPKLPPRG